MWDVTLRCALPAYGDLPGLIRRDHDPYAGVRDYEGHQDLQGWNSHHPLLHDAIVKGLPCVIVEVGVWKGGSAIFMGNILRQNAIDARIIAVDTWLGSFEHWLQDKWRPLLGIQNGRPTLYTTFLQNVVAARLADVAVPLPLGLRECLRALAPPGRDGANYPIDATTIEALSATSTIGGSGCSRAACSSMTTMMPAVAPGLK